MSQKERNLRSPSFFYVNNFFPKKLIKLGIPDKFTSVVGDQNFLRNYHKINKDEIIRLIKLTVKK